MPPKSPLAWMPSTLNSTFPELELRLLMAMQVHGPPLQVLITSGLIFATTYAALVWRLDLLSVHERLALKGLIRKTSGLRRELA